MSASKGKLGLIAGNGRFPFLVLDAARAEGFEVVVAAIKEEAFPEIESHGATVHWLSLGELSKLIDTFKREGVQRAIMAGQVKHKQIFSSIRPDWRLAKLLLRSAPATLILYWARWQRCWPMKASFWRIQLRSSIHSWLSLVCLPSVRHQSRKRKTSIMVARLGVI